MSITTQQRQAIMQQGLAVLQMCGKVQDNGTLTEVPYADQPADAAIEQLAKHFGFSVDGDVDLRAFDATTWPQLCAALCGIETPAPAANTPRANRAAMAARFDAPAPAPKATPAVHVHSTEINLHGTWQQLRTIAAELNEQYNADGGNLVLRADLCATRLCVTCYDATVAAALLQTFGDTPCNCGEQATTTYNGKRYCACCASYAKTVGDNG
jgi:hypothetical protein